MDDKGLSRLIYGVSIRARLFRAGIDKKSEHSVEKDERLNEHEVLMLSLLEILRSDVDSLIISDLHGFYKAVSLATLSNTTASLFRKGYISKQAPQDPGRPKRGYAVSITENGRKKMDDIKKKQGILFSNIVEGFGLEGEEDRKNMARYLENLIKYFDKKFIAMSGFAGKADGDDTVTGKRSTRTTRP